jgi:glucose-6-phosphate isomerase
MKVIMLAGALPLAQSPIGLDLADGSLLGEPAIRTVRTLGDLAGVFADEHARATLPPQTVAYRVEIYQPVPEGTAGGLLFGATFVEPGTVGDEYFITKGHFHKQIDAAEYYWCLRGEGVLLLMDDQRRCRAEQMKPGSLHYIPGRTAHRVANTGEQTLCFGACWPADAGHDYATIARQGFSARVLQVAGKPTVISV